MYFKIGCDPELFIYNTKTNQYVSGHDIVPGTKQNPFNFITDLGYDGTVQADGTAVELGMYATSSPMVFSQKLCSVIQYVTNRYLPKDCVLVAAPCVFWPEDYFKSLPDKATELGCEPDYNAYTGKQNVFPRNDKYPTMRTGAGHIHISWLRPEAYVTDPLSAQHFNDCRLVAMNMDRVFNECGIDKDKKDLRSTLYGAPGAFRPKKYGMEYRVPSNRWLHSTASMQAAFKIARYALALTMKQGYDPKLDTLPGNVDIDGVRYYNDAPKFKEYTKDNTYFRVEIREEEPNQ